MPKLSSRVSGALCALQRLKGMSRVVPSDVMRYSRSYTLCIEALHTYIELKKQLTRLESIGGGGRLAATIARSKLSTLERAAQLLWDIHREFSHYMNDDPS